MTASRVRAFLYRLCAMWSASQRGRGLPRASLVALLPMRDRHLLARLVGVSDAERSVAAAGQVVAERTEALVPGDPEPLRDLHFRVRLAPFDRIDYEVLDPVLRDGSSQSDAAAARPPVAPPSLDEIDRPSDVVLLVHEVRDQIDAEHDDLALSRFIRLAYRGEM